MRPYAFVRSAMDAYASLQVHTPDKIDAAGFRKKLKRPEIL
jgi:hypothetical protein